MTADTLTEEILVLGDSHSPVFNHPSFGETFRDYCFKVVTVIGATASGLENPNTKTQAYPIFKQALGQSSASKVIVMLGEVDTGFVIWYRAHKYRESVTAMMERAIASYSNFLLEVAAQREVICISTPLPTIKDGNDWGEVANLRREVTATQVERTALTLQFNRAMQAFCRQHGFRYIMLDEDSIGDNGVVSDLLLNRDPTDHHYDQDRYAGLLTGKLRDIL